MGLRLNRSGRPLRRGQRGRETAALITYLRRYEYLAPDTNAPADWNAASSHRLRREALFDEAVAQALANYQHLYGLDATGELCRVTRRQMVRRRCGCPDSSMMVGGGAAANATQWRAWDKRDFTYRFTTAPPTGLAADEHLKAFDAAANIWRGAVPNLTFTRVNANADIRVGWYSGHHGNAPDVDFDDVGKQLAHAWGHPVDATVAAWPGAIHLDAGETWSVNDPASGNADLVTQLAHELGHVLGLGHVIGSHCLMYSTFSDGEIKRTLAQEDIDAIQQLYP